MNKIVIDREKCVGCKTCYNACFVDVYRWDFDQKRPRVQYQEECSNCMYCVAFCPVHAIKIEVDYKYQRNWSAIPGDERPSF